MYIHNSWKLDEYLFCKACESDLLDFVGENSDGSVSLECVDCGEVIQKANPYHAGLSQEVIESLRTAKS